MFCISAVGPVHGELGDVDTSDALVIGTYTLSAYRVDKNYQLYIGSQAQGSGGAAPEVARAWFGHFLAEQVLTAHALQEGYGGRLEVTNEVRHMEHHMLTQFAGPFYQHLYSTEPAPLPALDALSASRRNSFDVEILRVPKEAPIAQQLNHVFTLKSPDAHESELIALKESGQSEYFSGNIGWPFAPFEEIASVIGNAPIGHWQKLDDGDTLLAFRVRRVRALAFPPGAQITAPPAEMMEYLAQRPVQKKRQYQILREAGLTFDWPAAQRWVDKLVVERPDPLLPLAPTAAAEMLMVPIASYHDQGTVKKITVADYISYYNDLYLRSLPRNALDIFSAAQSMIVAQHDDHDARALGIDRETKFVEDRRNYRDRLALDLYVRERIRPALGISDSDVAHYYEANKPAFNRPTRIEGSLFTFGEMDDAVAFARAPDSDKAVTLASHAQNKKTLVLTPTTELSELGFLAGLVFSNQTPRVLGPFPNAGAFSVWVFDRVTDSETRLLEAVSQEIRTKLEQPCLEPYEAELARKLSRGAIIEDRIAYSKYGIGELAVKPWSL